MYIDPAVALENQLLWRVMAQAEDPILEYRKWKQHGESLRSQARQAMEVRFKELLTEAAQIASDFQNDFGGVLKPPPVVTSFKTKAGAKGKPASKPVSAAAPVAVSAPVAGPKVAALERKLATAKKKLDAAKASGGSTKALEDRVYEIEDDLRLAQSVGG